MSHLLPPFVVLALATAALAQESRAVFDSAVVMFPETARILSTPDLDGDGDADAIGWWSQRRTQTMVQGYSNDGEGRFERTFTIVRNDIGTAERAWWSLETGRFDGDGREDFFTRFGEEITVYSSMGSGDPQVLASWSLPQGSTGGGAAVADFNLDGLDDIALALGSELRLYLNQGSGFVRVADTVPDVDEVHAMDMDGDGDPDLVVPRPGYLDVIYWDGTGLTAGPRLIHRLSSRNRETFTTHGDVDGDGDEDIVAFGDWGEYVVLRRTGAHSFFTEPRRTGGPATGLADVDGDGDLDGVCCGSGGSIPDTPNIHPSTFHISINGGGGVFDEAWKIPSLGATRLAGAVDVDADGDVDLVAGRVVLYNQDTFTRDPQPLLDVPANEIAFTPMDFDMDGDPDLQAQSFHRGGVLYRNDGSGGFSELTPQMPEDQELVGPGWRGDFDGDGDRDLVVARVRNGEFLHLQLLRNHGGGGYLDAGPASPPGVGLHYSPPKAGIGPRALVTDLDGDGDLDLLPHTYPTRIGINDGKGFFTEGQWVDGGFAIHADDFDGDDVLDLLIRRHNILEFQWGTGPAAFGGIGETSVLGVLGAPALRVADLDRDGDPDILAVDSQVKILRNDGSRQFTVVPLHEAPLTAYGDGWRQAEVADLNGDGILDLLAGPARNAHPAVWVLMGKDGGYEEPVPQLAWIRGLADVDGDGDQDILSRRLIRNTRFHGDGVERRQYGEGGVGFGGAVPNLGATGPFRVGDEASTVLTGLPGGCFGVLLVGLERVDLSDTPLAGLSTYVHPPLVAMPFTASGTAGDVGEGTYAFPYIVPEVAPGITLYNQAFVLDPSTLSGVNHTAGLRVRYGR